MASQVFSDKGQEKVVDILTTDNTWRHVGWGSGGETAAAVTQTGLTTANPEARTAGTISQPAANTHRVVAIIEATAARDVDEVAVFDASTGGNMIVRGTFTALTLITADRVRFTIDVVFKDSSE